MIKSALNSIEAAKRRLAFADGLDVLIIAIALVSTVLQPLFGRSASWTDYAVYVCALVAFVVQLSKLIIGRKALTVLRRGRSLKRRAMVLDAVPVATTIKDAVEQSRCEALDSDAPPLPQSGPYYSSTLKKGPARLREHLLESAFFSVHLFDQCFSRETARVSIQAIMVFTAFLLAVVFVPSQFTVTVANCALVMLSATLTADRLGTALDWHWAAGATRDVLDRVDRAGTRDYRDLLYCIAEYEAITSVAPPIPTRLYQRNEESLNKAYQTWLND